MKNLDLLKILIVEDNNELLEILNLLISHQFDVSMNIISAPSAREALLILENQSIDLCICDHQLTDDLGSDVLKYIISHKLKTKFILCSSYDPESFPGLYPIEHIFYNIKKPEISEGLEVLLSKIHLLKDFKYTRSIDYVSISVNLLTILGKAPSDIYYVNEKNEYIKLFNKNKSIDLADKKLIEDTYSNKIYTKRDANNDHIINELNKSISNILASEDIPLDRKISANHTQLKELIGCTGITPTMAELTKATLKEVVANILSEKKILLNVIQDNQSDNYASRFYTLHSMIISILAKKTDWDSHQDIYKLIFCAFVQDLSLKSTSLMQLIDHDDFLRRISEFSPQEQEDFINHPRKTIEILKSFNDIPFGVERIILEHHELPNKTGFPNELDSKEISQMGALFNLSGIFARYLLDKGNQFDSQEFLKYMDLKQFDRGHYFDTYSAIKSLFLTSDSSFRFPL